MWRKKPAKPEEVGQVGQGQGEEPGASVRGISGELDPEQGF